MEITFDKVLIVVMVPKKYFEVLKDAIFASGGGNIGNYSKCSSSCKIKGTFMPNEKANPTVGMANKLEKVNEMRLEFVCDVKYVKDVLKTIRKVHPYEEPAIDIMPLIDESYFK